MGKIKNCFLSLISVLFLIGNLFAGEIVLDGTYQGDNLIVQNPYNNNDNTYCITEVFLNSKPYKEINTSAFEIILNSFKIGQYVHIRIVHKDNCKPRILNKEVLRSKSTFDLVSIKIDDKYIKWTTKGETTQEPFVVEQFRNNKWTPVGRIPGKGPDGYNNYQLELNHHSGLNKYRIKQQDLGDRWTYKDPEEFLSNKPPITFHPKRVDREVFFSEKTDFEIFDSYGSIMKKGEAQVINVADLEPGVYYLNVDNKTEKFLKK